MKRKSLMKKGIAIITAAITVFASASTILAYEPFASINDEGIEATDLGEFGSFVETESVDDCDFTASDTMFVYEDGTQVVVKEKDKQYAICNHVMKKGYYQVHSSNNSGGCKVYVYNAKRCTKCGYINVGSLYSTNIYPVCPHK